MSVIRDPATYEAFETVVLVHGCRRVAELAYGQRITEELPADEFLGDVIRERLVYCPTVTREEFRTMGRITDLIASGRLATICGRPPVDAAHDRVMLCGSPDMIADMQAWLKAQGFPEGNNARPGRYVVEKAFVEK
jgi:ferredoxin--NADP+ reductase